MKAEITKQTFKVPCETHACRNRASYKLGNPKFPYSCHNLCEECMKDIVSTLPQELIDVILPPPEATIKMPVYDFEPVPLEVDTSHKAEEDEVEKVYTIEAQEGNDIEEYVSSMTKAELLALAEQRGIKVGAKITKTELLQVLGVE